MTPLHLSAQEGHLSIVEFLIVNGATINPKNCYQQTPLHLSAKNGHLEVVKYLVSFGGDINSKDEKVDFRCLVIHQSN